VQSAVCWNVKILLLPSFQQRSTRSAFIYHLPFFQQCWHTRDSVQLQFFQQRLTHSAFSALIILSATFGTLGIHCTHNSFCNVRRSSTVTPVAMHSTTCNINCSYNSFGNVWHTWHSRLLPFFWQHSKHWTFAQLLFYNLTIC